MSQIGYYRYKTNVIDGRVVALYKNGIQSGISTIKKIPACADSRIIKFIDSKGQYRFWVFNRFYEIKDSPKSIGSTNEFITSILTDQTNSKSIGYRNERTLLLTSDVTKDELVYLGDIFTSPRVYMYIGTLMNDAPKDWVEVTIEADNVVKFRKGNSKSFDITVTLPEYFTIKMV